MSSRPMAGRSCSRRPRRLRRHLDRAERRRRRPTARRRHGAYEPSFRPPDGAEILFSATARAYGGSGLFAVDPPAAWSGRSSGHWAATTSEAPRGRPRVADRLPAWGARGRGIAAHTHVSRLTEPGTSRSPPAGCRLGCQPGVVERRTRLFIVRGYTLPVPGCAARRDPRGRKRIGVEIPYPGAINRDVAPNWRGRPTTPGSSSRRRTRRHPRAAGHRRSADGHGPSRHRGRRPATRPGNGWRPDHRNGGGARPLNLSRDTDAIPCRARPPWPCRTRGDRGPARPDRASAARRT